ncbi:MAG: hypothetical protein WCG26_01425 [Chloroflexales bacterium]
MLQPIPATAWFCTSCGTSDPRKASALYHDVCMDCETPLPFVPAHEPVAMADALPTHAAVWAARSAALAFDAPADGTLAATLAPERFYALRDRARQAAALALLDGHGLLEFASACAAYLEERYGFAVPGLCVLRVWCTIGLLTAEVVA